MVDLTSTASPPHQRTRPIMAPPMGPSIQARAGTRVLFVVMPGATVASPLNYNHSIDRTVKSTEVAAAELVYKALVSSLGVYR
eukprot:18733-Eustigmatos_ZCMA.PRE.1